MYRKSPRALLILFAAILLAMSLSKNAGEKIRGCTAACLAPGWESLHTAIGYLKSPFSGVAEASSDHPTQFAAKLTVNEEISRLQLENQLLSVELQNLSEQLKYQSAIARRSPNAPLPPASIPARVIFRAPSTWNSSLWLNVGTADNQGLDGICIAKNSPVVLGTSIVGVVDYVGLHQCRVRLITDPGLKPSVRAQRSTTAQGVSASPEHGPETWLLAKGELHGSGQPLWRTHGQLLKGIGFNYDYADEEGPARDLRTGKPLERHSKATAMPILKVKDLLVTTGMDGVFPKGLCVAEVTKVHLLKEGDYYYELEAKPTAGNLDELSMVFILPPLGYDPGDQPPVIGR